MSIKEDKAALRREALSLRRMTPEAELYADSKRITAAVLAWPVYVRAQTVMLYASMNGEVNTSALIIAALDAGKRVALPFCLGKGIMLAKAIRCTGELVPGRMGIPEPPPGAPEIPKREIDLVVVPGLLFDRRGYRLGYAGGYYDRFLPGLSAVTIGLARSAWVADRLPREPHDVAVMYLAAPSGVAVCEKVGDRE